MTPIRFIAGSGRSGTTWIQDALAAANKLRPVFEPLHPYLTDVGRRYAHRALPADAEHPDLKAYFLEACAGKGPRLWTQYRQQKRWLFPPPAEFWTWKDAGRTKRHWAKFLQELPRMATYSLRQAPIVKCIRANLMLPWINRHLHCRTVLVVRHPGAVVESEIRGRWNASYALDRFRNDSAFHELTRNRYQPLLARHLRPVEELAARWVIENQWIMEAAETAGISVVHYEDLRIATGNAWKQLCSSLGLEHVPDQRVLTRPSQQSAGTRKAVPLIQSAEPRWMSVLKPEQATEVRGVLESVGFHAYAMDDPNPKRIAPRITTIDNARGRS